MWIERQMSSSAKADDPVITSDAADLRDNRLLDDYWMPRLRGHDSALGKIAKRIPPNSPKKSAGYAFG
jgi:hypothetical protein